MDKTIRFVFCVPVGVGHESFVTPYNDEMAKQDYINKIVYSPYDTDRLGQNHWMNDLLDKTVPDKNTYISFHGIDDKILPAKLSNINKWIKYYNNPAWIYFGHRNSDGEVLYPQDYSYDNLLKKNYIAGGAVFVRSDLYKTRRFRELAFWKGGADWDMWLRLGKEYDPIVINEIVYEENLQSSLVRTQTGLWKLIFNRIKYPIWRLLKSEIT